MTTHRDDLTKAHQMILEVMAGMNTRSSECRECGRQQYADWDQRRAYDALRGALGRIEKAMGYLDGNGTQEIEQRDF